VRTIWNITVESVRQWIQDGAFLLAAALSFYTVISLAPLVTLSLAAASLFYGEEALRGEIVQQIDTIVGKPGAEVIQQILASARRGGAGVAGVVSVAMLLFGASAVFLQLQQALNTVWNVALRPKLPWWHTVKARALSIGIALGVGALLLVSTITRGILQSASEAAPQIAMLAQWLGLPIVLVGAAALFAVLFKFLPDVGIRWRDAWIGAAITAVLFELGRFGLGIYLAKAAPGSTYGASGSLVALLLWIYYSALILLLGAEAAQVCARHRGEPIRPAPHAYRTSTVRCALDKEGRPILPSELTQ
jgi:membrane protein